MDFKAKMKESVICQEEVDEKIALDIMKTKPWDGCTITIFNENDAKLVKRVMEKQYNIKITLDSITNHYIDNHLWHNKHILRFDKPIREIIKEATIR